jgi:hypothetical protein
MARMISSTFRFISETSALKGGTLTPISAAVERGAMGSGEAGSPATAAIMVSLLDEAGRRATESADTLILEFIKVGERLALA